MEFNIILPEDYLSKALELGIKQEDIVEQFVRGSGHGGQKVNKTASTVYLKHLPTGTEVKCQKHREQSKNRVSAYKILIDKIEFLIKGEQSRIAKEVYKIKRQKRKRSRRAKQKMLDDKKHRSEIKQTRQSII